MKVTMEQIMQMSAKSLRLFVESETITNDYHGYGRTNEEGKMEGQRVGTVRIHLKP